MSIQHHHQQQQQLSTPAELYRNADDVSWIGKSLLVVGKLKMSLALLESTLPHSAYKRQPSAVMTDMT